MPPAGRPVATLLDERTACLPPEPASAGAARRVLERALGDWGHSGLSDVATLLVSEVVTNAVLHARSEVTLRARLAGGVLRVEAHDECPVLPCPSDCEDEAFTGRGLAVVGLLASSWGAFPAASGKVVWFELQATGDGPEPVARRDAGPPPEPTPPRAGEVELRLLSVPAQLSLATQAHGDALLRELTLSGACRDDAVARCAVRLGNAIRLARGAARHRRQASVDVVLRAESGTGEAWATLAAALDHGDELAGCGELLAPAARPEVRTFRRWCLAEVGAQLTGAAPAPWGAVAHGAPSAGEEGNGVPLAEVDTAVVLDQLPDAVVVADDTNRIAYLNPAAERLLGWTRRELVGERLTTIVPPHLRDDHVAGFTRFRLTGEQRILGRPVRVPALRRDASVVDVELTVSAYHLPDARQVFVAALRDLSDRVELERQVELTGLLKAVGDVALLLGGPGPSGPRHERQGGEAGLEEVAPRVLAALGERLGWRFGALWLVGGPQADELACAAVWRAEPADADGDEFEVLTRQQRFPPGVGLPGRVWASGSPAWVTEVAEDPNFPRAAAARARGLRGALAFPVVLGNRVLGVAEFFTSELRAPDPELLDAVATVGGHLGSFVERRRAEAELRREKALAETGRHAAAALARTLQASLLPPHLPAIPGLDVAARYRAAGEGLVVGGDFYDLFPLGEEEWGVVIGDVCGKGAGAAALTALARHTVRAAAMHQRRPSLVLADLNEAIARPEERSVAPGLGDDVRSATAAYLRLRCGTARASVELSSGGHPLPLLVRPDGTTRFVGVPGRILGPFSPADDLTDAVADLAGGDTVVLYTDGVTEARGPHGLFGEERLVEVAATAAGSAATKVAAAIEAAVATHTGGALRDDMALVVLRVLPEPQR